MGSIPVQAWNFSGFFFSTAYVETRSLWVMPLINSEWVLVKSTIACMYRGNEILGASGDFGKLGLIFFSNKLFLSSYVDYFKDWTKILSRLGSMSTLKSVQLKKARVDCVTYPRLSFYLMGRVKGVLKIYSLLVFQEVTRLMNG